MYGIAGVVAPEGLGLDDRARVVAMRGVMAYRGPDGAGLPADACPALAPNGLS
jgi:asparagine synthetase B (glutamine-hydrolysing)